MDSNASLSGFQPYTVDYAVFIHFDGNGSTGVTQASVGYSLDNRGGTNDVSFANLWKNYYQQQGWSFGFHSDNFTEKLSGYYGYSYATGTRGELVLELGTMTNNTAAVWLNDHLTQIGQWIGEAIYLDFFGFVPATNQQPVVSGPGTLSLQTGQSIRGDVFFSRMELPGRMLTAKLQRFESTMPCLGRASLRLMGRAWPGRLMSIFL